MEKGNNKIYLRNNTIYFPYIYIYIYIYILIYEEVLKSSVNTNESVDQLRQNYFIF